MTAAVRVIDHHLHALGRPTPSLTDPMREVNKPALAREQRVGAARLCTYSDDTLRPIDKRPDWVRVEACAFHGEDLVQG